MDYILLKNTIILNLTQYFWLVIVSIITMSIIAIFIGTTYLKYKRLDITKNSTFESISGLEYHRDKLDGLSPVWISYLTDFELEEDKDLSQWKNNLIMT